MLNTHAIILLCLCFLPHHRNHAMPDYLPSILNQSIITLISSSMGVDPPNYFDDKFKLGNKKRIQVGYFVPKDSKNQTFWQSKKIWAQLVIAHIKEM